MDTEPKVEEIKMDEYEAQPRTLYPRMEFIFGIVAITLSLFQLYTSWRGPFDNLVQRSVHIAFVFVILFATYPLKRKSVKRNEILWIDWILIILTLICTIWVALNANRFIDNPGESTRVDFILGVLIIPLVLEGSRRVIGPVLPIIAILTILYALAGQYLPGSWAHRGFSIRLVAKTLYISSIGIWGLVTGISATLIAGFLIFGVFLQKTGGGETFVDISLRIAGRSHGGPGKVACISSALFGTISGSSVANVVVDGVFNIPLMKNLNYKSELAAGIEATAATGGQIMPPVMGAGAFIMSALLGIPYIRIAAAAAIPAILYYAGCFFAIHLEAQRLHLKPVPSDMIPSFRKKILPRCLPFVLPASVLVYFLGIGYDPALAIFYAVLISTGLHLITARDKETLKTRLKQIITSLEGGGKAIVMVGALCACAQVVVSMFNMTGIGAKICQVITDLGQGRMLPTLFCAMIVCLILGMGVPTTAAYVLAASVVGPSLIILGAESLSIHLFIFYFACISAITPPVCSAVYVASAIAHSNWWKTGWTACKIGLPGFIVPYMFFYAPTLLLYGNPVLIVINSVAALIGVFCLAAGTMGFFLKPISWIERLLLWGAALLLIYPEFITDIMGVVILGAIYINQKRALLSKLATTSVI